MKRVLEIRAAEGGEDAKLFTRDLAQAYAKHFGRVGWKHRLTEQSDNISIEVEGDDLSALDSEPGGHRIQRVPPTERKGRVHTSTVTVAVIDSKAVSQVEFNKQQVDIQKQMRDLLHQQVRGKPQVRAAKQQIDEEEEDEKGNFKGEDDGDEEVDV